MATLFFSKLLSEFCILYVHQWYVWKHLFFLILNIFGLLLILLIFFLFFSSNLFALHCLFLETGEGRHDFVQLLVIVISSPSVHLFHIFTIQLLNVFIYQLPFYRYNVQWLCLLSLLFFGKFYTPLKSKLLLCSTENISLCSKD